MPRLNFMAVLNIKIQDIFSQDISFSNILLYKKAYRDIELIFLFQS